MQCSPGSAGRTSTTCRSRCPPCAPASARSRSSDTTDRIADRLRLLYGAAAACDPVVFVNLDMEEYRDLELTVAAFRRVLDEPPFEHLDAGIVLQAYLPDVHDVARELGEWAVRRRASWRRADKVRLVKGANLAMETVESEMRGWPTGTVRLQGRRRRELQGGARRPRRRFAR